MPTPPPRMRSRAFFGSAGSCLHPIRTASVYTIVARPFAGRSKACFRCVPLGHGSAFLEECIQPGVSGPADAVYAAGHQVGMLCSMRVRVRSTRAIPSLLASSSVGARFPRITSGVDSQCVAFPSSPNTATAWAITGTKSETRLGDVTILCYCGPRSGSFWLRPARPLPTPITLPVPSAPAGSCGANARPT